MKELFNFKSLILSLCTNYLRSFVKNMQQVTVKNIDLDRWVIYLYIRGNNKITPHNIYDVFFDPILVSCMTSEDASKIGYCYALSQDCLACNHEIHSEYSISEPINPSKKFICEIISLDRKRNVIFSKNTKRNIDECVMSPQQIIGKKDLIAMFNPIQACFIGFLAGLAKMRVRSTV